ncbi:TerC/Alx family metal homeostasis membrane protein [Clostridium sp. SYSU_GA19001]|uniref:TerC/Alx family metal homeostasis membrane protein n=1 Tax=Clostridium caldaquaticum TaxID=2940653 RepID=UPI002076F214|nr:TerC/Alx family metal homeostasis membrane protein [Clostridium caldaquaticum]MCM8711840.1 TerC/Alx family metal homeostasis membrane protein [Clostridium caldaquaticum]
MRAKNALFSVLFWMCMSILFNIIVYIILGEESALQFLGGYMIEFSLSADNLFLFLMVFEAFKIPSMYQRRVLDYGIIGAIILRLVFIILGISVINKFHWILYLFGAVLLVSGVEMMFGGESNIDLKNSKVIKIIEKLLPVTEKLYGEKFFVRIKNKIYATPLFAIILIIETSDILFAIDSIPAIFSITTNPFIVYTSNIFAVLGLRSMYFVLQKLHSLFCYVKYGVALILSFTGVKLLILFFDIQIPLVISLLIIFLILIGSIAISVLFPQKKYSGI